MPQPASFLRSWRKKTHPQTSPTLGSPPADTVHSPPRSGSTSPVSAKIHPTRRPSDTPSESSTRFLRLFKGNSTETDTSSLASVDGPVPRSQAPSNGIGPPHSPPFRYRPISDERPSPLSSPHSFDHPPHSPPFRHRPIPDERPSPRVSPHSLDRPLPPVPPVRPPRPPSLNLDGIELCALPLTPSILPETPGIRRSPPRRPLLTPEPSGRRKMPELDNVWKGFMKDAEGEDAHDFIIPPLRRGVSEDPSLVGTRRRVQAMLDPPTVRQPRPTMYRAGGSESTPYLACSADLSSESDSEYSNDETSQTNPGFPLSLFPAPPPLPMRRRTTPKPLVLLPTPTIAPLPPSPSISYSSRDSTPVATPTTPRSVEPSLYSARKSTSPVSILKKPGRSPASASPVTPTLPGGFPEQARSTFHILPPRLRSAQSVPHLQKPLLLATPTTHRNTSSDTTSMNNRRRTTSRPDASVKPQLYPKTRPPPSGNVEWGYAV